MNFESGYSGKVVISRLKATSIHLSLSAVAFIIVLYFILLHWFPMPHFTVNGGWQGVRIMLFVDIVLGPFLTLLLFNPAKSVKALIFDLCCIATMQVSAFSWGVYAVHSQRPVALTFSNGTVYPILEEELAIQEKISRDVRVFDDGKPPIVFARSAGTEEEIAGAFNYELIEGIPESKLFFLFEPVSEHITEIFEASLEKQKKRPKAFIEIREEYLKKNGYGEDNIAFIPFEGRYGYSLLVFDRSGKVIDSIPDPRYGDYSPYFF
jgi:hypothetical protein